MNQTELSERTFKFAVRIVKMAEFIPESAFSRIIAEQLILSAAYIGVNYREACRPNSTRDFIAMLKLVEEKANETLFWLEIIEDINIFNPEKLRDIKTEASEILAIFVTSSKTAKTNLAVRERKKKTE